jgi:SPP1 gp7 family putative phage head morphogenesis protein
MASVNDRLTDFAISHGVDLLKIEAGLRNKVLAMLKKLESSLVADLAKIDPTGTERQTYRQMRLTALLKQTRETIRSSYSEVNSSLRKELGELAKVEAEFALTSINAAVGVDIATVAVNAETLRVLVRDANILGAPAKDWWTRQATSLQRRFADQMRQGMLRGETLSELVQRVRGKRTDGFTSGIMQAGRRDAEALVRTSTLAVSNAANLAAYRNNPDVLRGIRQVSVLDSRTTPVCISYSGKMWDLEGRPIGHNLPFNSGPPRHWACRSVLSPITRSWSELSRRDAIPTGGRPTSISRFFEQRLAEKGFDDAEIASIKANTRASMDGQIPAETTFQQFLKQKEKDSPGFAAKMLGVGKAKLWEQGKLSLEELVNFKGDPLTLEQLREKLAA